MARKGYRVETDQQRRQRRAPKEPKAQKSQSDGLPKHGSFTLRPIGNPLHPTNQILKNTKSVSAWRKSVRDKLSNYSLLGLINRDASRPKSNDANEHNWFRLLYHVGKWLKESIHKDVRQDLEGRLPENKFTLADDVYHAIDQRFKGDSVFTDVTLFQEYVQFNQTKFYSPQEYIAEFQRLRKAMMKNGWRFPPYQAWIEIIVGLQSAEPAASEKAMRQLQDRMESGKPFTEDDLNSGIREFCQ